MRKFTISGFGSVITLSVLVGVASLGCRTPQPSDPALACFRTPPPPLPAIPPPDPSAAEVPPGYQVELVLSGLSCPSSVEFDNQGALYIAEAGYGDGNEATSARITRLDREGRTEV